MTTSCLLDQTTCRLLHRKMNRMKNQQKMKHNQKIITLSLWKLGNKKYSLSLDEDLEMRQNEKMA